MLCCAAACCAAACHAAVHCLRLHPARVQCEHTLRVSPTRGPTHASAADRAGAVRGYRAQPADGGDPARLHPRLPLLPARHADAPRPRRGALACGGRRGARHAPDGGCRAGLGAQALAGAPSGGRWRWTRPLAPTCMCTHLLAELPAASLPATHPSTLTLTTPSTHPSPPTCWQGYNEFSLLSLSCSDYLSLPSVGIQIKNRLKARARLGGWQQGDAGPREGNHRTRPARQQGANAPASCPSRPPPLPAAPCPGRECVAQPALPGEAAARPCACACTAPASPPGLPPHRCRQHPISPSRCAFVHPILLSSCSAWTVLMTTLLPS